MPLKKYSIRCPPVINHGIALDVYPNAYEPRQWRRKLLMRPLRLGVALWLCAAGCVISSPLFGADKSSTPGSATSIEAAPFSELAVYPRHTASAVVMPRNDSKLSAEVRANITAIPVAVGKVVKKGSILVELNKAEYELALQREQAQARRLAVQIELAQYQLQRAQKLQQQQVVAEELLKQRETELAVLLADSASQKAAIRQAEQNVERCIIRAPFDAVVVEKLAYVGELASPGTPLIQIVDAQQSEVSAKLQNYQIDLLQQAKSLQFVVRDKTYPLAIRAVTPVIDSIERTQDVRLIFNGTQALPGTAGELVWQVNIPHVPAELVVRRSNGLGIFVVKDNKAEFVFLADAVEGRPAKVSFPNDGLIVTKGRYRLGHGDLVKLR